MRKILLAQMTILMAAACLPAAQRSAAALRMLSSPNLVEELVRRGYSEEGLQEILGGNVLRVMRQVAQVSYEMQTGGSSQ
jgi:hypothetical protein